MPSFFLGKDRIDLHTLDGLPKKFQQSSAPVTMGEFDWKSL